MLVVTVVPGLVALAVLLAVRVAAGMMEEVVVSAGEDAIEEVRMIFAGDTGRVELARLVLGLRLPEVRRAAMLW
jgi:acyl dehydratase